MKRVLTAVVLVPLVLLVVFRAPIWLFALVVALVAVLTLHEYLNIVKAYGIEPLSWLTYVVILLFLWAAYLYRDYSVIMSHARQRTFLQIWTALSLSLLIFGMPIIFRRDTKMALAASAVSAFALLYIGLPLGTLILLRNSPFDALFLLFVLLSVWAGDSAAYYVGRTLGKHKLAPIISPKKTWEGAIASVIASVAVAFVIFHFGDALRGWFAQPDGYPVMPRAAWLYLSIAQVVTLGIVANVAAQFGDLFESAIKRGAQIKDSGSLLPGHGGMLDRIDAMLFAVPAVWYYAVLIGSQYSSPTF